MGSRNSKGKYKSNSKRFYRKDRKKRLGIFVLMGIAVIATVWAIYGNTDPRSSADEDFVPWSFSIISDTHAPQADVFTFFFNKIKESDSNMLFHVGDFDWDVYNQSPLSNIIALQDSLQDIEIHTVPGNHDVNFLERDNLNIKKGYYKEYYLKGMCEGSHLSSTEKINDQYQYATGNKPFNKVITEIDQYCDYGYTEKEYVFSRGGIRFIILDLPLYADDTPQVEWFKQKVCEPHDESITIAFTHETDFTRMNSVIDAFPCGESHDLKIIFSGHNHEYIQNQYKGVLQVELSGIFGSRVQEEFKGENDTIIAKVNNNSIDFDRVIWNVENWSYVDTVRLFSIPGNFTNYDANDEPDPIIDPDPINIAKFKIDLKDGLNFVSIPIGSDDMNASYIIEASESEQVEIEFIGKYSNSQWQLYKRTESDGFIGDDFDIEIGDGLIIFANSSGSFDVQGQFPTETGYPELSSGWNLVGFITNETQLYASDVLSYYADNSNSATLILADYVNSRYQFMLIDDGVEYGNDFLIRNGRSYFIVAK